MLSSISSNTLKQYSPCITEWFSYCHTTQLTAINPHVNDIITYLTKKFHEGASYGTLNCIRSALSLVIGPQVGTDAKIKRLFKGFFRLRPSKPKYNYIRKCPNLFISYKKPHLAVSVNTLSRWVKMVLSASGINTTIFSSHSTIHASTSTAFMKGVSIDEIRWTAGWTDTSTTFAKFYNRPILNNHKFAEAVIL
ncbi:hypothetical protein ACJJTC_003337 [Scirpophaga incertulas]